MDAVTPKTVRSEPLPTYYRLPAVKPSLYGWIVALYIYVGGLAAGLQIMVTAAELLAIPGSGAVSLIGRGIALGGAILGGILLIIDLHTKQRFYNMLRIFRPTSPMSIGTYVLMGFGFWSLLAFAVQATGLPLLALIFGCLAAATGWWMMTYTAALLAATATPLWAATPRLLAVRFASSACATGAAAACLIALGVVSESGLARAFGNIAALALAVELIVSIASISIRNAIGVNGPLQEMPWGPVYFVGVLLIGIAVPIVLYILANTAAGLSEALSLVASLCVLAGGLLMRGVVLLAGNESARRPTDYFRFAGRPRDE
jgi:formate-dependent nitrite reductase membrane component NrfD